MRPTLAAGRPLGLRELRTAWSQHPMTREQGSGMTEQSKLRFGVQTQALPPLLWRSGCLGLPSILGIECDAPRRDGHHSRLRPQKSAALSLCMQDTNSKHFRSLANDASCSDRAFSVAHSSDNGSISSQWRKYATARVDEAGEIPHTIQGTRLCRVCTGRSTTAHQAPA